MTTLLSILAIVLITSFDNAHAQVFSTKATSEELLRNGLYQEAIWKFENEGKVAEAKKLKVFLHDQLENALINSCKNLGGGIEQSMKCTLSSGISAIAKHRQEGMISEWQSNPLSDYTTLQLIKMKGRLEVAAYAMDQLLELRLVPMTVERYLEDSYTNKRIYGSFQYFVKNATSYLYASPSKEINDSTLRFFDKIIANPDRHKNNLLLTAEFDLIAIDNDQAFNQFILYGFQRKLDTQNIDPIAYVPVKRVLCAAEKLGLATLNESLGSLLTSTEIMELHTRLKAMLTLVSKVAKC